MSLDLNTEVTIAAVRYILENPFQHKWSYQGLGMMRLYLSPEMRLHIWNAEWAEKDVSTIHTHPWDFQSFTICGEYRQTRYIESGHNSIYYNKQVIGEQEQVRLQGGELESYQPGEIYRMLHTEIHEATPEPGTVTIIKRRFLENTEYADVYWDLDKEWVSAEPRSATHAEIMKFTHLALVTMGPES